MDPTETWVALNRVRGLTPALTARLLTHFGDAGSLLRSSAEDPGRFREDLDRLGPFPPRALEDLAALAGEEARLAATREIARAHELGVRVLTPVDEGYPARLLQGVPDPPPALSVRGSILAEEPAVAIVGSRRATPYGMEMARRLGRDLAERGYAVVSGLARGIDAAAHRGALEAGGRTLAVLGCGIDQIYPSSHARLAEEILRRGAILSEFPLGTPPYGGNFPIRNRVISGLSLAVVVVEAAERSGSLITARVASEQGRAVGAVPGPVTSPLSAGTHALLLDGARLVRTWIDIEAEIPEACRPPRANEAARLQELGERALRILASLSPEAPRHVDVLAGDLRENAGDLLAELLDLELRRLVVSLPGGHFLRRG